MREVSSTLNQKGRVAGRGYLAFSHHFARQLLHSIESPRRGKRFADFCVGVALVEVGAENEKIMFCSIQNKEYFPFRNVFCRCALTS